MLSDFSSLNITVEQVKAILADQPEARDLLCRYAAEDTETREMLADALAQYVLGRRWPMYGDNINMDAFTDALIEKALSMGFSKGE